MKHFIKRITALALSVLVMTSVAALAAPQASYNEAAPKNIVVTGNAVPGEPVGIKAMVGEEIAHIGMVVCNDDGSYTYKFSTEANINELSLSVSQDGNSAQATQIVKKDGNLYTIELDILDEVNDKFHIGADKKAKVRATISNIYGGEDDYSIIMAMYNDDDVLVGAEKIVGNMKYSEDGSVELIDLEKDSFPADCAYIKAYIWNGDGAMVPLAPYAISDDKTDFAMHKFIKEDGTINSDYTGEMRISFLGGSITEGGGDTDVTRFSTVAVNKLKNEYPNATITEFNAGIGGTGSNSGYMRLEQDVLTYNPDLVFVEYAVNDASHHEHTVYYEGIIRRLLRQEKQPVIIALYSAIDHPGPPATDLKYTESCPGAQRNWQKSAKTEETKVAQYYGIGEIDFDAEVERIYNTGVQVLPTYFRDNVHLNDDGEELYAQFIVNKIIANPTEYFKKINTEKAPLLGTGGFDTPEVIMTDDARITYTGEWTEATDGSGDMIAPADGGTITFTFKGTAFALSGNLPSGNRDGATYIVDGGKYTGDVVASRGGADYGESVTRKTNFFRLTDMEDCEHTVTITANPSQNVNGAFRFGFITID